MTITDAPPTTTIPHWIGGVPVEGTSGRTSPVYDPALGVVTKLAPLASPEEVDAAVASAKAAFPVWSGQSITKRLGVLFTFRELLNARKG